jgi:hypothetical protein
VYSDGLADGWSDWSWGVVVDQYTRDVLDDGRTMMMVTHKPFSGLSLHRSAGMPSSGVLYFTASPAMLDAGDDARELVTTFQPLRIHVA